MKTTRRGFLSALAAVAACAAVPVSLEAQGRSILSALMQARAPGKNLLFLLRKEDWNYLWRSLSGESRFGVSGFENILIRGVPCVWLENAGDLIGGRDFALISQDRFLKYAGAA